MNKSCGRYGRDAPRLPQIVVFLSIHLFGFQRLHPRLTSGIFPGTRLVAHADLAPVGLQQVCVIAGGILAATVGMMHQPDCRPPQFQRSPQRRQGELVLYPVIQCPANHAARIGVDHCSSKSGLWAKRSFVRLTARDRVRLLSGRNTVESPKHLPRSRALRIPRWRTVRGVPTAIYLPR
jgi:hypothetical protein